MNTGLIEHLSGEQLMSNRAALHHGLPTALYILFFRSFHSEGPEMYTLQQTTHHIKALSGVLWVIEWN